MRLAGKVALVTGSSRGIGRAVALALAQAGANVAVNYRATAQLASDTEQDIRAIGRRTVWIQATSAVVADVEALVARVRGRSGRSTSWSTTLGIIRPQPVEEIRESDWDELIAVNLKSCFPGHASRAADMRARQWGRMINMSSVAAQIGGVVGPHYAASKAGMHGLTHYYASRYAKEGITVNTIAPALIETEMVASNPNARAN